MASTYLTRTPASAGNSLTFTISMWVKRTELSSSDWIIRSASGGDAGGMYFNTSNNLAAFWETGGVENTNLVTNRVLRDINAFYHIVLEVDTTQATASNRLKLYINGEQETSFSTSTYPSQNTNMHINKTNPLFIGTDSAGSANRWSGIMVHAHLTDGTAYDASYFGETDSLTGIWKPKTAPNVTYGTNGFFLKFENSSAFGTDSSGNSNTFTVNGIMTQTIDTPSNVFATKNLLDVNPSNTNTFANGNTTITTNGNGARSTLGASTGKYYAEVKYVNQTSFCGIMDLSTAISSTSAFIKLFGSNNGEIFVNGSSTDTNVGAGTAIADNSIIMFAMDLDNNRLYIGKNGLWWTSGSGFVSSSLDSYKSFTNTNSNYWGFVATTGSGSSTSSWNFGNGFYGTTSVSSAQNPDDGIGIFEYDVPAGYRALCTKSINAEEYS